MSENIDAFLSKWTTAERDGDAEALEALLADDFYGVGPLGFVLPRAAWLDRHRQGLAYEQFGLEDVRVRHHGAVALVTARNNTRGTYRGQPIPEALRATLVIVSDSEALGLAAIHMSFLAGTRGAPPMPLPDNSAESSAQTPAVEEGR
ncbi:MAG: nuclear transport factor 2 family protein [Candidatus Dormiibacterota bacterium]